MNRFSPLIELISEIFKAALWMPRFVVVGVFVVVGTVVAAFVIGLLIGWLT